MAGNKFQEKFKKIGFPAPLEVDRELYTVRIITKITEKERFPAPREVDREL